MDMDKFMYDERYDTDGDKGPVYKSIDHEVDLGVNIEEEAHLSKENFETLMANTENHVHDDSNNNDVVHCIVDGNINRNTAAGDPGSFVLIFDEDIDRIKVKDLQDELKEHGLAKRRLKAKLILQLKQVTLDRMVMVDENAAPPATSTNNARSSNEIPRFTEGVY
eukprot:11119481-Ditylum_brightwellii.AAC.1